MFSSSHNTISMRHTNLKADMIQTLMLIKHRLCLARMAVEEILGDDWGLIWVDTATSIAIQILFTLTVHGHTHGCHDHIIDHWHHWGCGPDANGMDTGMSMPVVGWLVYGHICNSTVTIPTYEESCSKNGAWQYTCDARQMCYTHTAGLHLTPCPTSILTSFLTIGLRGLRPLTITLLHLIFHLSFHFTISHFKSRTQIQ